MTAAGERDGARRVAVLGTGMIGAVHRRSILLAGAELAGVVASTSDRSRAVAREWGVPDALTDLDAILDSDVEVVHVCTPNATHVEYARRALLAGKHVVVEKPIGVDLAEALELRDVAAHTGRLVTVPFVYRYHPIVRELRARRQAGDFGPIHTVHGAYLQDWLLSAGATSWRVDAAAGGASRAFGDIGSHWCDLVEWVAGTRFTELSAATSIVHPERPASAGPTFSGPVPPGPGDAVELVPVTTEDTAVALLRAPGVLGSVTISQLAPGRKNRLWFELDGTEASAVFDQEHAESAWIGDVDGSRTIVRDPSRGSAEQRRLALLPAGHAQGYADCFDAFVADTYAAIDGASPDGLPTIEDGVRAARIVEAVLTSARTGRWVAVDDANAAAEDRDTETMESSR